MPVTARTVGDILADLDANPPLGDNGPPTPLDAHKADIDDLYEEAKHWLDGSKIENQGQAHAVTKLRDEAKKAGKAADTQRAAEKKPHDDAGKAVQAAWKPLTERADKIEKAAGGALATWLIAEQARKRAEADRLAEMAREAEEKARADHIAAAQSGDLGALEAAEQSIDNAALLDREARASDRYKPQAKVEGMTRAVGLRTVWDVALADAVEGETAPDRQLAAYFWRTQRERVIEFYLSLAQETVRKGGRSIPGCAITSRQVI